jgi:hypothetical protein
VTATLLDVDPQHRVITPTATRPGHDTPYYRNVQLAVRQGQFTLVDASGTPHALAAEALGWVVAGNDTPRLLVLGEGAQVLAELPPDGWDPESLAEFGDEVGAPLVEEFFPDALSGRAAYPLPKGALRVHARELRSVVLQFLPVVVPVVVIIILVIVLG